MDMMRFIKNIHLEQTHSVRILQLFFLALIALDFTGVSGVIKYEFSLIFVAILGLIAIAILAIPIGESVTKHAAILLLGAHYVLTALLLIFMTPVFGPYFQLLILLILASVVWLNARGALYSVLLSSLIVAFAMMWQGLQGEIEAISQAGLYLSGLAIFGFLFERVTAQHRAEAEEWSNLSHHASFEHTRLMSLVNSIADAVVATDNNGKISMYNAAALDLFNTNQDLNGADIRKLLQLNDESGVAVDIIAEAAEAKGPMVRDDIHMSAADNSRIDLYMSISQVYSKSTSKSTDGYIILLRDITKQKTLEEQRDEFISVASHELRTPIAIAEANISTALMPKFSKQLTKEGRNLLNQAHENVVFLSTLINDLHVLAQAEQGRLNLDTEEIDPRAFLQQFGDNYRKQAEEKDIEFEITIDDDTPNLTTSQDGLKEILQNFMTNAIKYTESGKVCLFARPEGDMVVFGVADTGIGISEADQKHVFEKFYRSEDYRTRQSGGTGLGLYIIKRLAERMGGEVWFESQLNKGSTFYCSVPVDVPEDEEE